MTQLSKKAYVEIIKQDIEWLLQYTPTIERKHIQSVLMESIKLYYPENEIKEKEAEKKDNIIAIPQNQINDMVKMEWYGPAKHDTYNDHLDYNDRDY
jgi:hypothetical protein